MLRSKIYYIIKNSFYPHKQKFSEIYVDIVDSIVLTDDEVDNILGEMELDLENIFFSNDEMFLSSPKEIQQTINEKIVSFDKKLTQLYEKINM